VACIAVVTVSGPRQKPWSTVRPSRVMRKPEAFMDRWGMGYIRMSVRSVGWVDIRSATAAGDRAGEYRQGWCHMILAGR